MGLASNEGLGGALGADLLVRPRYRSIDCFDYRSKNPLNPRPARSEQHDDRNAALRKVLLVLEISVGGHEDFEPILLCCGNESTVLKLGPAQLVRGYDGVCAKSLAQRRGCTLIEEDLHLCRFERTSSRMLQYCTGLLNCDARKPFDEFVQGSVVFKVLEQGRHRHPGASEDPGSAYAAGVAFNCGARRPVDHAHMVALRALCAA